MRARYIIEFDVDDGERETLINVLVDTQHYVSESFGEAAEGFGSYWEVVA